MNYTELIGRTLDDKYQIERELGRGGMGTVYLATHLGTERPVAIKVIAPQFMERPEFVERFRREARAAGRLRHPNVVDVTDFGFAHTNEGQVAYLVMEYLDGCTLGEILEEEKNLPVGWTLDILEQVCSAVHEAHEQGIIHRDLKPDNIWLEPNQRGGYTVKVLDFGIAKLEAHENHSTGEYPVRPSASPTFVAGGNTTFAGAANDETIHDSISPTVVNERATMAIAADGGAVSSDKETLIQPAANGDEGGTLALKARVDSDTSQEAVQTRLMSVEHEGAEKSSAASHGTPLSVSSESDLTRVGAVLGTPLYMSPEQCRGDKLDARSDIYSLGVIAYQMLSGETPFKGDFTRVMESHKFVPPPPLNAKKVRKKLKRVINSALTKDPDGRPQTAEAFSSSLRSRSEGIFGLLRRAGMIYTEHIQKFLILSAFFHIPMIIFMAIMLTFSILRATEQISETPATILTVVSGIGFGAASAFGAYLIIATTTWIVCQSMAVPLRPIKLRSALREAHRRWKTILGTGILTTILQFALAAVTCGIGFVVTAVLWTLVGPVVMMENLRGWNAIKRSTTLVRRSLVTSVAAVLIMFLIPSVLAGLTSAVVNLSARAIQTAVEKAETEASQAAAENKAVEPAAAAAKEEPDELNIQIGRNRNFRLVDMHPDTRKRVRDAILEVLLQIILLPLQIVMTSFTAIIVALLYLKTRQAGGEPLQDLLARFEDSDKPRKKWQERVRQRLIQSGRITSRS